MSRNHTLYGMNNYKGGSCTVNMKKMTQKDFDEYVVTCLIPEIQEEHGSNLVIVLTETGRFKFAKECESCHDYIILDEEYEIPRVMIETIHNSEIVSYLEVLTGLDVYESGEINECECFEDEIDIDQDNYSDELYEDDLLAEDTYDDYEEY